MSKKWLIGAIGTTVMAAMVLSGCGANQDDMGGNSGNVSGTSSSSSTTSSTTSTTSSTSAPSTSGSSTSSTSGGLMDEITNVQ